MMRKLFGAAAMALLLITPTVGYAEEAVLGENESSPLVTQVRARAALLRDWDEYLAEIRARDELISEIDAIVSRSDEAVLGEQARASGVTADDPLALAIRARVELLRELVQLAQ
jgi:hypothetical protein